MSSTSLMRAMDLEGQLNEYPFPRMPTADSQSSSSDNSLPRVGTSTQTKSQRTAGSSSRHARRGDRDRGNDEREREYTATPTRLLSRLYPREERDSKHVRTLLMITTTQLESETRRADQAEQRVVDCLERLRQANESITVARTEAAKANEQLRLYKIQLDQAKRELQRAQETINQVEQERIEAEATAARARTVARRYREDSLLAKAREEGRREGFQEGYNRGRTTSSYEQPLPPPQPAPSSRLRPRYRPPVVEEEEESDEDQPEHIIIQRSDQGSPPRQTSPPNDSYQRTRPRSNTVPPPRSQRSTPALVSDAAPFAPTLPVPTLTTPVNAPSLFHSRPTPSPGPNQESNNERNSQGDIRPIPVHNAPVSPMHPPVDIPPDGYVPFADDDNNISIPPAHEFERPVSPMMSPAASARERSLPVLPPQGPIYTRDYAQVAGDYPSMLDPTSIPRAPSSPQSRTSTNISQMSILNAPRGRQPMHDGSSQETTDSGYHPRLVPVPERSRTPVRPPSRADRETRSPRGPRDLVDPSIRSTDTSSSSGSDRAERRRTSSGKGSALGRLFKRRFDTRTPPSRQAEAMPTPPYPLSRQTTVPNITVESPSTHASSRRSSQRTSGHDQTHMNLLSPDHANRPLPMSEPIINYVHVPEVLPTQIYDAPPPNFIPTSFEPSPKDGPEPLPVPPPGGYPGEDILDRAPSRHGSASPRLYVPAPVPHSVVYPDPPARSKSATPGLGSGSPPRPGSSMFSPRSRKSSLAGRLSPLNFGKQFAAFAPSDDS
ncbi:hypothetical protein K474DRAFT_1711190 [Panus rudis PR-1116 ss-1]|nr:hypothetical protein K474DRAFT_1711190 [Panus rudis PR-1116 ss-1]